MHVFIWGPVRRLLTFQVVDRLADGRVVDHFGLGHGAGDQSRGADLIDPAWEALRPFGDALEGVVGEEWRTFFEPSDFQVVLDISQRVFVYRVSLRWCHRRRQRGAALGLGDQVEHERFGAVE